MKNSELWSDVSFIDKKEKKFQLCSALKALTSTVKVYLDVFSLFIALDKGLKLVDHIFV